MVETASTSPGQVLAVLRAEGPLTREQLRQRVGLSRVTMVERIDALRRLGLLRQVGHRQSSGGRRAELLAVDDTGHTALVADLGQSHATLAVVDLRGTVFAREDRRLRVGHEPGKVVPMLVEVGRELLAEAGRAGSLRAVALAVPGRIDHERGRCLAPPTMPGWSEVPLRDRLADAFGVPVLLENDANAGALGDYYALGRPDATLVGVRVGIGIGAGLVIAGRVHRGQSNAAGEIGHMRVEGSDRPCSCGRRGCVAAEASGQALSRLLRPVGVRSVDEVVSRVADGQPRAVRAVTEAGRLLGTVLTAVVTVVNPRYMRFGGAIGVLEPFLAGVRTAVQAGASAGVLDGLDIGASRLGANGAFAGLSGMVADELLAPSAVDALCGL
ncbi:transcriptional regulator/sugar kinase [Saccharomonospora marina XMU15]|uniref:Transcriptional regulator/sugar kinase n=1 Tax=Saccharomonospora marina XMU15 TaxID=882083 RepID=H5X020_9PSEU|nr:ROK family protein [Saccharomonospora marina]EHR53016.1 transcriptional regulator/sugar kinase [Saccharomonospora marina XMU15]